MGRHCSFFLGLIRTDLASLCGECRFLMPILQLLGTHNLCPFLLYTTMARLHHEALQRWLTLPCRVNCVPTKFQCTEKKSCKRSYYRLQHRPRSPKGRLPANPEANLLPIVLPYQWMLATCIGALPPLLSGKALTKRSAMSQIRVEGGPPSAFCSVKTGN